MSTTRDSHRGLDPDTLALLEEERDFLLHSIDDLKAEHAAGDIDSVDYDELIDDYTKQAASIIRGIEKQEVAFSAAPRISWLQVLVWVVGLALLGGLSGTLIARTSGTRTGNDTITGGVRQSVGGRLGEAQTLLGDQERWDEAIEIYETVLDDDPSNAEALTYKAWIDYRQGAAPDEVLPGLEEAGRLDPDYPDAVVFNTIVLADASRYDEAAQVLDRLYIDTAPEPIIAFLEQRGLTGEVYGEIAYDELASSDTPSLAELGLSIDNALAAAQYLLTTDKDGRAVAALKLYRSVQDVEPDHPVALSREAVLLALTGEEALLDRAQVLVDRAVKTAPDHPEALLSRATVGILSGGDTSDACADLSRLLTLRDVPPTIQTEAERQLEMSCS